MKKTSKVDLWRGYGLGNYIVGSQVPGNRYKSNTRKSIMWWLTSRACRMRDWRKYGRCVSCNRELLSWEDGDGGHYCPASSCGPNLLFNPMNVALECPRCNAWAEGHLIGYRRNLVLRYGEKEVIKLESLYLTYNQNPAGQKEWTQGQYDIYIKEMITEMVAADMLELTITPGVPAEFLLE